MMVLLVIALAIVGGFCIIFLIQELDAWLWHWWHYSFPAWRYRRQCNRRYREFERRNRW